MSVYMTCTASPMNQTRQADRRPFHCEVGRSSLATRPLAESSPTRLHRRRWTHGGRDISRYGVIPTGGHRRRIYSWKMLQVAAAPSASASRN